MSATSKKFNPWPWSILGFFVCLIGTIIGFVAFAMGQDMQLVRDDYYDHELRFQREIDEVENARGQGSNVSVEFNAAMRSVRVKLPAAHVAAGAKGRIEFYRPSDAKLDFSAPLLVDGDGSQWIGASEMKPGLWKVRLSWAAQGRDFLFRDSVVIPKAMAAPGQP